MTAAFYASELHLILNFVAEEMEQSKKKQMFSKELAGHVNNREDSCTLTIFVDNESFAMDRFHTHLAISCVTHRIMILVSWK